MASSNVSDGLILNGDSFNPQTDMKYTKPKVNKSGGKAVGILNNGNTGSANGAITWTTNATFNQSGNGTAGTNPGNCSGDNCQISGGVGGSSYAGNVAGGTAGGPPGSSAGGAGS